MSAADSEVRVLADNELPADRDRVRITIEGTQHTPGRGFDVRAGSDLLASIDVREPYEITVAVMTPPKPWDDPQPGDIVRLGTATYLRRTDTLWADQWGSTRTGTSILRDVRGNHHICQGECYYIRGTEATVL